MAYRHIGKQCDSSNHEWKRDDSRSLQFECMSYHTDMWSIWIRRLRYKIGQSPLRSRICVIDPRARLRERSRRIERPILVSLLDNLEGEENLFFSVLTEQVLALAVEHVRMGNAVIRSLILGTINISMQN